MNKILRFFCYFWRKEQCKIIVQKLFDRGLFLKINGGHFGDLYVLNIFIDSSSVISITIEVAEGHIYVLNIQYEGKYVARYDFATLSNELSNLLSF